MQRLTGMFADKQYIIEIDLATGHCQLLSEPPTPIHVGVVLALEDAITDRARLLFGESFRAAIEPPTTEPVRTETAGPGWPSGAHHDAEDTAHEPSA